MNGVFSACSCTSLVASFINSDRSLDLQGKSSKTDVSAVALLWQNRSWLSRKKGGAWDGRKRSRAFPKATGGKWGALASQTLSRARKTDRLHPEVRAGACRSLQSRNRNSTPKSKGRNTILFWQKKNKNSLSFPSRSHLSELCVWEVSMSLPVVSLLRFPVVFACSCFPPSLLLPVR